MDAYIPLEQDQLVDFDADKVDPRQVVVLAQVERIAKRLKFIGDPLELVPATLDAYKTIVESGAAKNLSAEGALRRAVEQVIRTL